MILDSHGNPTSSEWVNGRKGDQVEGFQLPDGAIVSKKISMDIHKRIQNDSTLRERLEIAQRMTGRKILHLSLLDHSNKNVNASVNKAIEKNLDVGEEIQRHRANTENLTQSEKAYEAISLTGS
jgi:hypothetical protein